MADASKNKLVAGLLAIFLGTFGIHKFYLGYTVEGVIMLCVTLLIAGFLAFIISILALVEGIIYLTRSEEDFQRLYVENKKGWL